jgi:uncharacterized protein
MQSQLIVNILWGAAVATLSLGSVAQAAEKALPRLSADDLQKIEAAVPQTATAQPKKARRILVFHRCEGFVHGGAIVAGNHSLELMGKKTGAFTADFSTDYADLEPANLAKYDALIFNNTTQLKMTNDVIKKSILDFVRGGKGIIGIHAATDNFYNWPEGARLMGGLFDGHPWGGGGTWGFAIDDPNNALTKVFAGKSFKLKDEVYQFKDPYTRSDRRVLVTLDLSDPTTAAIQQGVKRTDKDFASSWIRKEGQGRVFFNGLGHERNVFMEPAIMKFYLDGIQYALGDLAADDTPKAAAK